MKDLTPRQLEILQFIERFLAERGYPPTIREIAAEFRIVSLNAVRIHLKAIERKGYLQLDPKSSRGMRVTETPLSPSLLQAPGALSTPPPEQSPSLWQLPLLGRIAAGAPVPAIEEREDTFGIDISLFPSCGDAFLLKVRGESMAPLFQEGDLVIVKPQQTARDGDFVVAVIDGEATVKEFHRTREKVTLKPLNPLFSDIEVSHDFLINGKVVGLIRRF